MKDFLKFFQFARGNVRKFVMTAVD